jgi:hypothetical protein
MPTCGTRYVFCSDINGTIELGGRPTVDLLNLLLDAAEDGHEVFFATHGLEQNNLRKLQGFCHEIGRSLPDDVPVLSKFDVPVLYSGRVIDVAFDNEDFNYLPNRTAGLQVTVSAYSGPDLPYDYIREKFQIPRLAAGPDTNPTADVPAGLSGGPAAF